MEEWMGTVFTNTMSISITNLHSNFPIFADGVGNSLGQVTNLNSSIKLKILISNGLGSTTSIQWEFIWLQTLKHSGSYWNGPLDSQPNLLYNALWQQMLLFLVGTNWASNQSCQLVSTNFTKNRNSSIYWVRSVQKEIPWIVFWWVWCCGLDLIRTGIMKSMLSIVMPVWMKHFGVNSGKNIHKKLRN